MNRIRTIQGAADELRKRDPGCAISAHCSFAKKQKTD